MFHIFHKYQYRPLETKEIPVNLQRQMMSSAYWIDWHIGECTHDGCEATKYKAIVAL